VEKDLFLRLLIGIVNNPGRERTLPMPITLICGGTVITGTVISEAEYVETIARDVVIDATGEDEFKDFVRSMAQAMDEKAMQLIEEGGEGVDSAHANEIRNQMRSDYIHLKDSRLITDTDVMHFDPVPWRGKISAVDGFWLGLTLAPEK
jgi:hypothetical protein